MRFGGRKTPKEKKEGRQRQQRVISCSSASDSNDGSGRCFSDDKFSGCRIEVREGVPQYFLNLPFHFGFRRRPQAHCLACDLEAIVRELWAHFVSSGCCCCCRIYHSCRAGEDHQKIDLDQRSRSIKMILKIKIKDHLCDLAGRSRSFMGSCQIKIKIMIFLYTMILI